LISGKAADWPDDVFVQVSESQVGRAVRTDRWKYGVTAPDGNGWADASAAQYEEQYLYDLQADPYEQNNLVSDPKLASVRDELRERLVARMIAAGELRPQITPAMGRNHGR